MKKITFLFILFCSSLLIAKGQAKFEDFVNQFPLLNSNFTWTGDDLEKARTSGKKIQGAQLFFITDGQGAWGEYFPIARVEVSGTIFVFWAYHTGTYDNENTQIHLCSRAYDKKGKPVGVIQNYMASSGGVKDRFNYTFEATYNNSKKTLFIDQKSTDKPAGSKILYAFSKKGHGVKSSE